MTAIAQRLAQFAVDTTYDDLPDDVVDYSKMVLLDTLICGIAACRLERSRMANRVIQRLGGPPESTVFGLPTRVAAANAAYANAEMMNALDADDTFFNAAHFAAMGVAAAVAEAERVGATGAELIRASTLAFEINARLNLATSLLEYDGDTFRYSKLSSHGYAGFGAATATALLSGMTAEHLASAFGLVAWTAPTAKNTQMSVRTEFGTFKYAPYGAITSAGVLAAALAAEGYVGDVDVLDVEPGFVEAQGYRRGDAELLTEGFGETWWISETALKPFPSCRYTHAAIDAVLSFQADHAVELDAIESIEVRLNPAAYSTEQFRNPMASIPLDHRAPLHGAFHIPYVIAVALLGVPAGPQWYDQKWLEDPEVWKLAGRITTAPDLGLNDEWRTAITDSSARRPRRTRSSVTLRVGGVDHLLEDDYTRGDPWFESTRPTWAMVEAKLDTFCAGILPSEQQQSLLHAVRTLETVDDVSQVLSPLLMVPEP